MSVYIKSAGLISAQPTYDATAFPSEIRKVVSDRLMCIEPEYRNLINPILLRRMPRILKMGLGASQLCINRSGILYPDGIIVGTGLGCLDNLEKFLVDMLDNNEHITSVLPFINSTHNAVAAQVSMLHKNQNYNTTYCHRGFSFESALLDAMMLIDEDRSKNVLVGGIDECTPDFMLLHSYLNDWKRPLNNLSLLSENTAGTIAGEGSAFFMLSGECGGGSRCVSVEGVQTFLTGESPECDEIESRIETFIHQMGITLNDVEGVMLGLNGDSRHDGNYYTLSEKLFADQTVMYFKHLCGEYYTSVAFALWLSSVILGGPDVPDVLKLRPGPDSIPGNILVYNQVNNTEHSLIYLKYGSL